MQNSPGPSGRSGWIYEASPWLVAFLGALVGAILVVILLIVLFQMAVL